MRVHVRVHETQRASLASTVLGDQTELWHPQDFRKPGSQDELLVLARSLTG